MIFGQSDHANVAQAHQSLISKMPQKFGGRAIPLFEGFCAPDISPPQRPAEGLPVLQRQDHPVVKSTSRRPSHVRWLLPSEEIRQSSLVVALASKQCVITAESLM